MKPTLLCALALISGSALAQPGQTQPVPAAPAVIGNSIQVTAIITVGPAIVSFAPPAPRPAYTLQRGTHLQFVAATGLTNPVVTWYKDGTAIATGPTLDIPAATPADTGRYMATAVNVGSTTVAFTSERARVLVNDGGQRFLNCSTRVHLDAARPSILSGFVVEPGPASMLVLVRAIGPTLSLFGITDALPAPQLKVMNAQGQVQTPVSSAPIEGVSIYPSSDEAAARVGAFPLPAGSLDVANVYLLRPGAYAAQVSAPAGTAGTVLLEIYEVPLRAVVTDMPAASAQPYTRPAASA